MKTTFNLNFDFYKAFKPQNPKNLETKRSCQLNKLLFNTLLTCNLKEAIVNNYNLNEKSSSLYWHNRLTQYCISYLFGSTVHWRCRIFILWLSERERIELITRSERRERINVFYSYTIQPPAAFVKEYIKINSSNFRISIFTFFPHEIKFLYSDILKIVIARRAHFSSRTGANTLVVQGGGILSGGGLNLPEIF